MTENTSASNEPTTQRESRERYERIGAELRRRREALSLEQSDVARRLHLPGMVVNDIETGQVDKLSGLYRRGYIRNYARLLELDPDDVLADAGEDVLPQLREVLPVSKREWKLERYLKVATYAVVTVAIVAPLVYLFIDGGTRMLDRDPAVGDSTMAAQPTDRVEQGSPDGVPDEPSRERSSEPSPARHVSASALPLNPVRPSREGAAEEISGAVASPDPSGESPPAEEGTPLSALELQLLEDSWIEIHDAEGTRLEYDLLRSGQTRSYEGLAPFRLLLGRSSAVTLQVNGQQVIWDGHESGDVAEIAIAANGEVER